MVLNTTTKELFAEDWNEITEQFQTVCAGYIEHHWLDPF